MFSTFIIRIKQHIVLAVFILLNMMNATAQNGFSVNQASGCAPLISTFTYTAGANPTFLSWDFGNSTTLSGNPATDSGLLNPTISYLSSGSYTVSLEVSNDDGTTTYESVNFITVYEDPNVNFSANATEGCGAFPVSFSDLSTPGDGALVQWNWDFGDAGSSIQQNPTHLYTNPGVYDVSLSVTDANGCNTIFTIQDYITVTDGVYPSFSLENSVSCEIPTTISVDNTSTGAGDLSYSWDFGNSVTSSLENPPNVTYTDYGFYTVVLTLSNDLGCTQSAMQFVSIQEYDVDFSTQIACLPGPSVFINQSNALMNTFLWDFDDPGSGSNNSSTSESPAHVFSEPGTYNVTLTASIDGTCETSHSVEVTINEASEIVLNTESGLICNFPTEIEIEIDNDDVESFVWFVSHNGTNLIASGDENSTFFTFDNSEGDLLEGNYNITMQVNYENGCIAYLTEPGYLNVDSINFTTIVDPGFVCEGVPVSGIDYTTFVEDIETHVWDWGDTNIDIGQNVEHIYTEVGDYIITLSVTSSGDCEADTLIGISVGAETFPDFTYPDTTVCAKDSVQFTFTGSGDIDSYSWTYIGQFVSNLQNPIININEINTQHLISLVTENNGCLDTISYMVDINSLGPLAEFSIIPSHFCKEDLPYLVDFLNTSDSTDNTTFSWEYTGDTIPDYYGTAPNGVEFLTPGAHPIMLYAVDSINGCSDERLRSVIIDEFDIYFNDDAIEACDQYLYEGSVFYLDTIIAPPGPNDTLFYYWDFGDSYQAISSNFSEEPVTHNYTNPGTYTMQVYSENRLGCPDTISQTIIVHPSPSAAFTLENESICPPSFIDVNNASIEMDTSIISWTYILSSTDTVYYYEENPSIYIESPILYNLVLAIEDGFGCVDTTLQVLNPHAILMDYYLPEFLCYETAYTIENNISSEYTPLEFFWEFGNGESSTENEPVISVDSTEALAFWNYLTVTDASGCNQLDSFLIQISVPDLTYSFQIDEAACPPIYADFSLNSFTPADTFMIDYGDGESNYVNTLWEAQDMSHVYDTPGIYDVLFTIVDIYGCSVSTFVDSLVIVPGPWASFDFSPNSGCPPLEVNFEIIESDNVSDYFWVFGDGYTSSMINPTHTYTLAGTYTPILLVQDSIDFANGDSIPCIVTIIGEELIIDGPLLEFLVLEDTLCLGDGSGVEIENQIETIPGFEINSYFWDYGDGFTSSDANPPIHIYTDPGYYTITLIVTTVNGCEYTLEKEQAVYVMEIPSFAPYIEYIPTCPPMQVSFYGDTLTNPNPEIHFNWTFGDGAYSSEVNPIHTYLEEGSYTPQLSIDYYSCTFSSGLADELSTLPVPEAHINAIPLFTNNSVNEIQLNNESIDADAVDWFIDNSYYSSENEIIINSQNDSILVFLVAYSEEGCSDTTWFSLLDFNFNVPNIITPNGDGRNDLFVLNFDGFGPCIELMIFDRWGLKIYESANYLNDWNGRNQQNKKVSDGTYFYIINICDKTSLAGYITVAR